MRNIKIVIAYDGSDFAGWQVQNDQRTVQGVLQEALARMHGHPVRVQGAGRTDSGVHAIGQVGNFKTDIDSIESHKFRDAINSYLPFDIRILASEVVPERFDSRRWAKARIYRYYIFPGDVGLPHLRKYCIKIRRFPDMRKLNAMASLLVGEKDFTTFAAKGDSNGSKIRRVFSSVFYTKDGFIVYQIAANAFLWKMVRSIVGTILELEGAGGTPSDFRAIVEGRDRNLAGSTAPARGLFLEKVIYGERDTF